jgi:Flp pilus assembly protein TadD
MSIKKTADQTAREFEPVASASISRAIDSAIKQPKTADPPVAHLGLARIVELAESGKLDKALHLASPDIQDPVIRNARGVVLIRLGRYEEAIAWLRKLVMAANCTWMRPEIPVEYKINFATALLLGGKASGSKAILEEIQNESHPAVRQIRQALQAWYKAQPFWDRLRFRLWGIQRPDRPVTVDFSPGIFGMAAINGNQPPATPANGQPGQPTRLAV